MTSKHCFVAETLVATIDGMVPIEDISPGDLVLSEDPETGDVTYQMVWETYENDTNDLIHLTISKDSKDGKKAETEEIVTTPAHPFYVKDTGFVTAEKLTVGTTLVDNEGNEIHLLNKRWQHLRDAVPVYNFAVDNYHTYFVGSTNVLVHNMCASKTKLDTQDHHFLSNKSKKFTSKFMEITDKYGLDLNDASWNIEAMTNHIGRHTDFYHNFMLRHLKLIDAEAAGNIDEFLRLFENLKTIVKNTPGIMYTPK